MIRLKVHPEIRELIPPLAADELELLEASLRSEGVRDRLVTWQGYVVDGHNRLEICLKGGPSQALPYDVKPLPSSMTLEDVKVWLLNNQLARRNIVPYVKAELVLRMKEILAAQAKARMEAGVKRDPTDTSPEGPKGETREKLGAMAGVSGRTMDRVAWLNEHADDETKAQLRAGKTTPGAEHRRIKADRKKAAALEAVRNKPEPPPDGPFDVIVADFPWAYHLRTEDGTHRNREPYPPMSREEVLAFPMTAIAADDCILWLWVTNAHLLDLTALDALSEWGFEPKTMLTWGKTNGIGAGHWLRGQTEHVIMAVRGKPLHTLTNQSTRLDARRREHSRKPDEFYELVDGLCPGSKVELFAREQRDGWHTWGAEKAKFS